MDTNLFASVFKYRPRHNREPLEDFVTECIGYFRQNDKAFLEKYLELVLNRKNIQVSNPKTETNILLIQGSG